MKELIRNFPSQVSEALQIGKSTSINFGHKQFDKVLVSGLGGSGIGASIVRDYIADLLPVPFLINKNYFIPKCTDAKTLFIACSYSGNTEETLQAATLALKSKATLICICSGGELSNFAKKHRLPLILIPSGMPPRACLGYSFIQILYVLKGAALLKSAFEKEIIAGLQLLQSNEKLIHKEALRIAGKLLQRQVAIYCNAGYEGLAVRFRQQLNENSKVLAWHNVIPEMTHNEIVGWKSSHPDITAIFCYSGQDFEKNIRRMNYLKKVVKKYTPNLVDLKMKGNTYWERALYFIHLTDWISVYLADLNGQDAVEVKVIDGLKKEMSKK